MPLNLNGYVRRTAEEIKQDLLNKIRIQIPDFNNQPADIQNDLIDTAIQDIIQYEQLVSIMLNGYSMAYATDDLFRKQAEEVGLRQKSEFKSQATLTFKGLKGEAIPQGTIVTDKNGGNEFVTQSSTIINSTGIARVNALGESDETLPAGTLTKLKTLISNSIIVTNETPTLKRIESETMLQLKARSQAKLRAARAGGRLYAETLTKGINGVDSRLVAFYNREYDQQGTNEDGSTIFYRIRGIEAVIGGGDEMDIAMALYNSFYETHKLVSRPSDNDATRTSQPTIYVFNSPIQIPFTRPKLFQLRLILHITFLNINTASESVRQATEGILIDYINNLQVGTRLNTYVLLQKIMPKLEDSNITPINYKSVSFSYNIKTDGEDESNLTYEKFNADGFLDKIQDDIYLELIDYQVQFNT